MPMASSTVGIMSITWAYCSHTEPAASITSGQVTMNGSLVPPRYVSPFQRRNGVFPAQAHPNG